MNGVNFVSIIFIFLSLLTKGQAYVNLHIELQHALDLENLDSFSFRANVSIPSLNSGLANVVQSDLTGMQIRNLMTLADRNEFYRLMATIEYPNGSKMTFLTSTKASGLIQTKLNDILWISVDVSGFVTGVTETTSISHSYGSDFDTDGFRTDVLIRHTELAPVPDTASFIQKVEREREARERGEVRDNRGFFAKYWMYIVPVALLVFISGATNQEQPK